MKIKNIKNITITSNNNKYTLNINLSYFISPTIFVLTFYPVESIPTLDTEPSFIIRTSTSSRLYLNILPSIPFDSFPTDYLPF